MAKADLTSERLRELLHYNPDTGVFTWLSRAHRNSRVSVGCTAGNVNQEGYEQITIDRMTYKSHRLAWFYMHGVFPFILDHINGDRRDNRMLNLRIADKTTNNQNRKNDSGFVKRGKGKYLARIYITLAGEKLSIYLGTYESEARASEIYHAAKILMHPGYCP